MVLAPENLVIKEIGGQKVKAKELLQYFKSYLEIYKGDELPEPKSMLVVSDHFSFFIYSVIRQNLHHYEVFLFYSILSILIDKDGRACQNISIQFPCCLSYSDLFNFW